MKTGTDAMAVALRVLDALNSKSAPADADVAELRRLAPLFSHLPVDELACDVIQQALKRREQIRKNGPSH